MLKQTCHRCGGKLPKRYVRSHLYVCLKCGKELGWEPPSFDTRFDYFRKRGYNVKRNQRVTVKGRPARIVWTDYSWLRIKIDGDKHAQNYHPGDERINYAPAVEVPA